MVARRLTAATAIGVNTWFGLLASVLVLATCLICARESTKAVCPRCKPMIQDLPNGLTVLARVAVVR